MNAKVPGSSGSGCGVFPSILSQEPCSEVLHALFNYRVDVLFTDGLSNSTTPKHVSNRLSNGRQQEFNTLRFQFSHQLG